jgi:CheY-like chemotaxis protein
MGARQTSRPIEILLVEDNPADARLTRETLKDSRVLNKLHHVKDGVEALAFLEQRPPYQNAPVPDVMLLDLNLPRKDGRELLEEVKGHPQFRRIPVVVLTTSEAEQDILKSYDLHANCYLTKPVDLNKFIEIVKTFEEFWLTIVKLPTVATEKATA